MFGVEAKVYRVQFKQLGLNLWAVGEGLGYKVLVS